MRKCLLFAALLMVSQLNYIYAQGLFLVPDTVCARQPIKLVSNVPGAASHYWGFCSGYLLNKPSGFHLDNKTVIGLDEPCAMEIAKDGENYYALVANRGTNKLVRLEYGNDLGNIPTVTDFGDFSGTLPTDISTIYILKDSVNGNWHAFMGGGVDEASSQLCRVDFGKSMANVPNIVNFGNPGTGINALDFPTGIFVAKEDTTWYGFVFSKNDGIMHRLDIGSNISFTPTTTWINAPVGTAPTDMAPFYDNGQWFFFITNDTTMSRVDMGSSLTNTSPGGGTLGTMNDRIVFPSGITMIRDCDNIHAFITNRPNNELVRIDMTTIFGPYNATILGNIGGLNAPNGITKMLRDKDDVYAFVPNGADSSISRLGFVQCTRSSIPFSTHFDPPPYSYDTAGYYNIYYIINEGEPTMQVNCQQIRVLPIPPIEMSNDTTICQGDTVQLKVLSVNALSYTWTPNYNITDTTGVFATAWPRFTTQYRIVMPFANGCIVDTAIDVTVNKVVADAGPDRTITDGSATILGGPMTSIDSQYGHIWRPVQYMSDPTTPNPVARPPYDLTYYLEVTDTTGCRAIDTVVVYVQCNDINLPNAFAPTGINRYFGIANKQIVQLNYFRIYDRWGKEVFSTTDVTQQWDGRVNGDLAPLGVYVWEADGFCISGQKFRRSGNVTLVR